MSLTPSAQSARHSRPEHNGGGDTQWYCCDTELGVIRVGVVVGEAALAAMNGPLLLIRQAALLSEVELILQAFEIWQHVELDLRPEQINTLSDGGRQTQQQALVELFFRHKTMSDYLPVRLQLAAQALPRMKPVSSDLLLSLELSWSSSDALLELDQLAVSSQEFEKLGQGALLLLPRSYQPGWPARLIFEQLDNAFVAGQFELETAVFSINNDAQIEQQEFAADAVSLSVYLQQTLPLNADKLLADSAAGVQLGALARPLLAALVHQGRTIAMGALGPLGAGYALYIHEITQPL